MSKHTPGPWVVDVEEMPTVVVGPDEEQVAFTMVDSRPSVERRANARLISAAPQLLLACARMLQILESANSGGWRGVEAEEARAAIAKAEGRDE